MAIVFVLMAFLFLSVLLTAGLLTGGQEGRTISDGRRLLDAGEAQAARKVFERLARQRSPNAPGREPALFWLGRTLEELGRFDDARRVYLRYLQDYDAAPGARATPQVMARVRERLAELLRGGPASEASAWAAFQREQQRAAREQPDPEFKLLGIPDARRFMEEGKFEQARTVLQQVADDAAAGEPARENAFYLLGLAQEGLGRSNEALVTYRRYVEEYGPSAARPATPRIAGQVHQRTVELEAELEGGLSAWAKFVRHEESKRASDRLPVMGEPAREPTRLSPEAVRRDLDRLDVGLRVGEYVLAEKLGEGGMGEVFRALQPVAIKFARTPESVEHLRRFGALQGQIKSDRIVKPLKIDLDADPPYVVMEYVDGPTLRELLRVKERLAPEVGLSLLLEVARGLRDAHRAGVLHLDLKPENVLLDGDGSVKLTDFELGRLQGEASQLRLSLSFHSSEAESLAGTLAYMSPEQRAGKVPDVRSDVYTFGVMLFEALTGTLPEPGDRPSDFVEELPPQVDAIFERCFARLERRYVDADELVRDLERLVVSLPVRAELSKVFGEVPRTAVEGAVPRLLRGLEPRRRVEVAQLERALRDALVTAQPAAPEAALPAPIIVEPPAPIAVEAPAPIEAQRPTPVEEAAAPAAPGDDANSLTSKAKRPDLDEVLAARRVAAVEAPQAVPEPE
jgi:serine/threonine protein kinase